MHSKTDWFAWWIQAFFGLLMGLLFGFMLTQRQTGGSLLRPGCNAQFIWGTALIVAGLASIYGDRIWLSSADINWSPDGVRSDKHGKRISFALIITGALIAIFAIIRHLQKV